MSLQIKREQVAVFESAAQRKWEEELLEHARAFAPEHTAVAGEANMREAVRLAMRRSAGYGFTDRGPVRLWMELALSFGSGFDTDPLLPWTGETLRLPLDQHSRAARLYNVSRDYFVRVHGQDDALAVKALKKALHLTHGEITGHGENLEWHTAELLRAAFPEKHAYCGPAAVDALVRSASEAAQRHVLTARFDRVVLAGMLFVFGHQADADPLYPWIGQALDHAHRERGEKLHHRFKAYAKYMIPVLEGAA